MARYIAFLRGINVGRNSLKMERIRQLSVDLGFAAVQTYLQSGNLLFDCEESAGTCCARLEKKLIGETRLPVRVLIRSAGEMKKIVMGNPFLAEAGVDRAKLHVTFLEGRPLPGAVAKLGQIDAGRDRFGVRGKDVFLYCPDGYGRSKLSNNVIERILAMTASTRNWNTVETLQRMLSVG